jgi:hypothetical protein
MCYNTKERMRIYKHRIFHQWAKSEELVDGILIDAINEISVGIHDGSLGSGLYKKRMR